MILMPLLIGTGNALRESEAKHDDFQDSNMTGNRCIGCECTWMLYQCKQVPDRDITCSRDRGICCIKGTLSYITEERNKARVYDHDVDYCCSKRAWDDNRYCAP